MTNSSGPDEDNKKDKPDEIVRRLGAVGYLERRAERIVESRQAIVRIAGAIRETMHDIANQLASNPSAEGQAALERVVSNLQGLTKAADRASDAVLSDSGDSGGNRGAEVDLTGIKAAVETRRDSSSPNAGQANGESTLQNLEGKKRDKSRKAKDLASLDAANAAGADQTAPKIPTASVPGDAKPPADVAPVNKADRFKLAFANSDDKADPSLSGSSDLAPLAKRATTRPNAASLKLDHAEATHAEPASTAGVSASRTAAIEPPKQDEAKQRQGAIHSAAAPHKPSAPAAC